MKASDLLTELPITIEPDTALTEARDMMDACGIRHLPVTVDERVVGMLSDRDTLLALGTARWTDTSAAEAHPSPEPGQVSEIMSSPVYCVGADTPVEQVASTMLERGISIVPIIDAKGLLGVISKTDLVRWYLDLCAHDDKHRGATARVEDGMRRNVASVSPCDEARQVVKTMINARVEHVPVIEDGKLVGIIADRDLRRLLGVTVRATSDLADDMLPERFDVKAGRIMTPAPKTIAPDDRMAHAATVMLDQRFSAMPVANDDGVLLGVVTVTDVVRLVRELAGETQPVTAICT